MKNFLVFQLYAPLAAWGDIAVGEYRPTTGHPSKSAVLGLVGAALGIHRHQEEEQARLQEGYGFAACVLGAGQLLRDFHTIQVAKGKHSCAARRDELCWDPERLTTILSRRDYRMDALCLAALWEKPEAPYSLEHLRQSLRRPRFILYLGRKSCPPALPLNPQILRETTLKQAFAEYPGDEFVFGHNRLREDQVGYYWERDGLEETDIGIEPTMTYPRRDVAISRTRWQFTTRSEYTCTESIKEEG